ncbi:tRNA glutamyl-Q(34) synthetase GluQRS [Kaistia dalseonensis]|uniref:Glutamyl-Q tRNA(Asp) synthetase n=1 Tax=Kaistia dalseonensis TaxID=410840 RepID=A0ABU0H3S9_9HYPH|nr:tRNA glutamyl-Q(34) synthetase GluQRS [Kaistia dalseonensis]MCX5494374.1 tRNA glutamyl-Q(34) synthetase GluQRS [Kaistia dalseonensis]MDQ0436956.1 glutamyl-Q tRNA(Asp) synthetase [Kaistia dalseonensis]
MSAVFRFAPSPNGLLHLGHAYSALLNADLAAASQGRLLLRIEDIDTTRCKPEFEQAIHDDLAWLGIDYERPVRRQSEHFDAYRDALARLDAMGLIYPAFLSRAEIRAATGIPDWPRDPDGAPLYPGVDRDRPRAEAEARIAAGAPYALRLRMDEAMRRAGPLTFTEAGAGPAGEHGVLPARPELWGDVILARKEVPTSYHLSVVVDDALQGVTHVVRGQDLFQATSVHRLLQALLGLPEPLYHHHGLIRDATGRKLSKSDGDAGLAALRAAGVTPDEIRQRIGLRRHQPTPST